MREIEIRARLGGFSDHIGLLVVQGDAVGTSVTMERRDAAAVSEPTLRLSRTAAQQLIDELWHCGLRPTEGTGSAGSLAATQKHLADMRALVFMPYGEGKKP